jgi:superfamily II DNA or RNA helicase
MITLRPYQETAVTSITSVGRGIVVAPAGSGKTIIAAAALDKVLRARIRPERARICWIANTIEQCQQAQDAMSLFSSIDELAEVSVCCYAAQPDLSGFDCVIADECHHVASECNARVFARCKRVIWGFTATPIRADGLDITQVIGEVVCEIEREQLVEDGNLAKCLVEWLTVPASADISVKIENEYNAIIEPKLKAARAKTNNGDLPQWIVEEMSRTMFRFAQKFGIYENTTRDSLIIEKARELISQGQSVIILVGRIEHGETLMAQIDGSELAYSGMGKKNRRAALGAFKAGGLRCLIATQILEEGADLPIASALINAAGGKSTRKSVQTTGRVLRPFEGKECGLVIDFMDNSHGMLTAQSWQRFKTYQKLNYKQRK